MSWRWEHWDDGLIHVSSEGKLYTLSTMELSKMSWTENGSQYDSVELFERDHLKIDRTWYLSRYRDRRTILRSAMFNYYREVQLTICSEWYSGESPDQRTVVSRILFHSSCEISCSIDQTWYSRRHRDCRTILRRPLFICFCELRLRICSE